MNKIKKNFIAKTESQSNLSAHVSFVLSIGGCIEEERKRITVDFFRRGDCEREEKRISKMAGGRPWIKSAKGPFDSIPSEWL